MNDIITLHQRCGRHPLGWYLTLCRTMVISPLEARRISLRKLEHLTRPVAHLFAVIHKCLWPASRCS